MSESSNCVVSYQTLTLIAIGNPSDLAPVELVDRFLAWSRKEQVQPRIVTVSCPGLWQALYTPEKAAKCRKWLDNYQNRSREEAPVLRLTPLKDLPN